MDMEVRDESICAFESARRRVVAFVDLADAQHVIGEYLDGFYNTKRMHSTIDYCSLIEYEVMSTLGGRAASFLPSTFRKEAHST